MKIGEFAKKTGLTESTIRYYEKQGFLKANRINGIREFEEQDLEFANFIKRLKAMGMPLKYIKQYADLRYQGPQTIDKRFKLLQEHRQYLVNKTSELQDYIQNLDNKLSIYQEYLKD